MATGDNNKWGRQVMILADQNDDGSYDADNDVVNGGAKYSSLKYKIDKIAIIDAANGDTVKLDQCDTSSLATYNIIDVDLETGDLNKVYDFPNGLWVKGICPTTLQNSSKVLIYQSMK
ncbi:MAG: hypothetical protein K8T10_16245 [Candidatus Eremiobacteraeota bacterium]|nr:hypothetical protein [Candidatus Eremiobacteraeota bacterium]